MSALGFRSYFWYKRRAIHRSWFGGTENQGEHIHRTNIVVDNGAVEKRRAKGCKRATDAHRHWHFQHGAGS